MPWSDCRLAEEELVPSLNSHSKSEFLVSIGLRFLYGLATTGMGVVVAVLTYADVISKNAAVVLAIVYLPVLLSAIWLQQYRTASQEERLAQSLAGAAEAQHRSEELERRREATESETRAVSYGLMTSALDELGESMSERLTMLDKCNCGVAALLRAGPKAPDHDTFLGHLEGELHSEQNVTYDLLTRTIGRLCQVFTRDTYAVDRTKYGPSVFKATVFVPVKRGGRLYLVRDAYKYPAGQSPTTNEVSVDERPRSALVLSFLNEETVVIEDIEAERTKSRDQTRWEDFYAGQAAKYKSMVSTYIVKGGPRTPSREVIAVLTIDTNRERYFREDNEWQMFLSTLLKPFRVYIALLYEIRRSQELLVDVLKALKTTNQSGG